MVQARLTLPSVNRFLASRNRILSDGISEKCVTLAEIKEL